MSTPKNTIREPATSEISPWRTMQCASRPAAIMVLLGIALLGGCAQRASADETPPVSGEPTSTTFAAQPGAATTVPGEQDDQGLAGGEDDDLRRGYGAVDMRFNACVTRTNDHTLRGEACPSGFVVYGPYVAVPAKSEIEVTFELKPTKRVEVYADIVTRMAAQTLAGLSRQTVEAGVNHKLGYRVHVFNADVQVESRIGMTAEPGTEFEITNLTMTVR